MDAATAHKRRLDFERLEVRSFGLFISELLGKYDARLAEDEQGTLEPDKKAILAAIVDEAMTPIVRPQSYFHGFHGACFE